MAITAEVETGSIFWLSHANHVSWRSDASANTNHNTNHTNQHVTQGPGMLITLCPWLHNRPVQYTVRFGVNKGLEHTH